MFNTRTSSPYPCASDDELKNLEVEIDGEALFKAQRKTRAECLLCSLVWTGTHLAGVALLLGCLYLVIQRDVALAINLSILGMTLLLGSMIGLQQYQNAPKRITLDKEKLEFVDTWTGLRRRFPREGCLEATYGETDHQCAIYVTHPNHQVDLLVEGLSEEVTHEIVNVLNRHLHASTPTPHVAWHVA